MNFKPRGVARKRSMISLAVLASLAIAVALFAVQPEEPATAPLEEEEAMNETMNAISGVTEEAIFAGGCFWCIEAAFELMPGVIEAVSGYTGGHVENPTYEQVSTGTTGHFEAVRVTYDPTQITYGDLLEQYWRSINPIDPGGQFYDRGSHYFTAIFYLNEDQRALAEASKQALEDTEIFDAAIATVIRPAETFYIAEDYHQDYYENYLAQYKAYNRASGREAYLEETQEALDGISLVPSEETE